MTLIFVKAIFIFHKEHTETTGIFFILFFKKFYTK